MKISGRNIKRRPYGLSLVRDKLARAKHFRGHGVHSPFVYGLVRKAFMPDRLVAPGHCGLHDALLAAGIAPRRAVQLQNVAEYCGCTQYSLDAPDRDAELAILTADYPAESLAAACSAARQSGRTVAIMSPYACRERRNACREIVGLHRSTSVDNRGYLLIFNNHLPKQHFML